MLFERGMNIILAVALSLCATHDEKPVPGATIIIAKPDGSAPAATPGDDRCATAEVEPGTYRVTIASVDGLLVDADVEVGETGASKTIALKNASEVAEPEGSRTGTGTGELREAYAQDVVVTASRERVEETRRVIEPEL